MASGALSGTNKRLKIDLDLETQRVITRFETWQVGHYTEPPWRRQKLFATLILIRYHVTKSFEAVPQSTILYWAIRYHICNSSRGHLVVVFDMHLCILSVVVSLCDNLEFKTYLENRYQPFFLLCFGSYLVIFRPCPDLKLSLVSHHNLQQSWLFPFCVNQAQLDYLNLIYSKSWGWNTLPSAHRRSKDTTREIFITNGSAGAQGRKIRRLRHRR